MSRHATDPVSLVFGLIFAGLATNWLLIISDVTDVSKAYVTVPVVMIAAGVAGLVSVLRRTRQTRSTDPAAYSADD